jgi:hypothetical protein
VDVVYGGHWLFANLRTVVLFIVGLPKTVAWARMGELPPRAVYSIRYREGADDYWHRRVQLQACGCRAFRGHVKPISIECVEHWGFDDDELYLDDGNDSTDSPNGDRSG